MRCSALVVCAAVLGAAAVVPEAAKGAEGPLEEAARAAEARTGGEPRGGAALTGQPLDGEELLRRARAAERAFDFQGAWSLWSTLAERDDSGAWRTAAETRLHALESRRDRDGGWTGLERIERARIGDEGAAIALEQIAGDPRYSATLRVEVALWLEGRARRAGRAVEGAQWLAGAPTADARVEPGVAARLRERRAAALAAVGSIDDARAHWPEGAAPTGRVEQIARAHRDGRIRIVALGTLGLWFAAATLREVRGSRSRAPRAGVPRVAADVRPGAAAVVLLVGGAGALAELWEAGGGRWALWFTPAALAVHVIEGRWPAGRWTQVLAAAATLAFAWLSFERSESLGMLPW